MTLQRFVGTVVGTGDLGDTEISCRGLIMCVSQLHQELVFLYQRGV